MINILTIILEEVPNSTSEKLKMVMIDLVIGNKLLIEERNWSENLKNLLMKKRFKNIEWLEEPEKI